MYISLYHGRNTPDEQMEGWGFQGPIIGPVTFSWTYGELKVHDPEWDTFEELPQKDGLILLDGKYYGDFELWEDNDKLLASPENQASIISYEQFVQLLKKQ